MAIKITNATAQPAVVFDHVHLINLVIEQPLFENDAQTPHYKVTFSYRMYGVDNDNKRHYKPETHEVEIDNYLLHAAQHLEKGDPKLFQALQGIEDAIASILEHEQGVIISQEV